MNILILNWKDIKNPTSGGAELVTYEHARRWVKAGHSVTWLSSAFKNSKKNEKINEVNIVRFGNIYTLYLYAPFFYFFSGQKFDIVVDEVHGIPFFTPPYVRKPVLVLIHEIAGEIWDYMYGFPINYFGKILERAYLRLYRKKHFWTDAEATIDELVRYGVERKKCLSIPAPSNIPVLSKPPIKNKELTLVWVSRIVKMKGIEDVIEAFYLISKKHKNAKLNIIGSGEKEYIDYLKNDLIRKYYLDDKVNFLGFVDEKRKTEILRKSHLLLHASVKEGWGIVVIEAASQGTPSVVYNVPGLSESVVNKKTGIVLSTNSPAEMAENAIKLFLSKNDYRKYQKNCLEWAESLTWDKESEKSLDLINKITDIRNDTLN